MRHMLTNLVHKYRKIYYNLYFIRIVLVKISIVNFFQNVSYIFLKQFKSISVKSYLYYRYNFIIRARVLTSLCSTNKNIYVYEN